MNDKKIWLETEDGQKLFIIKTEKCDMQKELTETIDYLQQELQRKDNIINELKKHLEYEIAEWQDVSDEWTKAQVQEDKIILDKIKELENDN